MLNTLDTIPPERQRKLTELIETLCKTHGIKIQWNDTMDNRADHVNRTVRLKRIYHFDRFASCLHEIAHLIVGTSGTELDRESRAWEWAVNWAQANEPFDRSCWAGQERRR